MTSLFAKPDKEKNYQGYITYVLSIMWAVVISGIVSVGFIYFPHLWLRWLTFDVASIFIALITISLSSLGYGRLASIVLIILVWLLITIPCYTAGGILAPGILSQVSVILTAGFLLGWRGGLAVGLLTIGTDFWFAYLEANGNLPAPTVMHSPITRWISTIIPFSTIMALQYYATNHLHTSVIALQREILRREEAEKISNQTVYNLKERVKELKLLYNVSRILQNENTSLKKMLGEIADVIPSGWQYPEITEARICFSGTAYTTKNYKPSEYSQQVEVQTMGGSILSIEVVYLKQVAESDEGPFLHEERNLINMLAEMIKMNLERREGWDELKDYKYALDVGYMVSIAGADGNFTYVNDNFCKISKFSREELLGNNYEIIMSGFHPPEYFMQFDRTLQEGKSFRGEFFNRAKDGTLYWVEATIIPFLDDNGKIYQYLSINHDITETKEADDKIKQSEQLLKKITSHVPGNTYMFEIEENGYSKILFTSRGTDTFNQKYELELLEYPGYSEKTLLDVDKLKFNEAMKEAYRTQSMISFQYKIIEDGKIKWRWLQAVPEKDKYGKILWYGATRDITTIVDYIVSIEQIIFDIGHVIRRPVATMLGITKLINYDGLNEKELKEISVKLYTISEEMDKFIIELYHGYQQKRQNSQLNIDISSLIDKRKSMFN